MRLVTPMGNRKKDMIYHTFWIDKEENKILVKLFKKKIKTEEDLKLIGDIFSRVNSMGDLK